MSNAGRGRHESHGVQIAWTSEGACLATHPVSYIIHHTISTDTDCSLRNGSRQRHLVRNMLTAKLGFDADDIKMTYLDVEGDASMLATH